jgi:hypothetical protein
MTTKKQYLSLRRRLQIMDLISDLQSINKQLKIKIQCNENDIITLKKKLKNNKKETK